MVYNIITIKNETIPYLDEESIEAFENVKLISTEGLNVKINCLLLCAMSNSLKMAFDEFENDHTIVTEFSLEELKQIKKICMTGSCDGISQSLLQAFGFKEVMNNIDIKYEPLEDNEVMSDANEVMDQKDSVDPFSYMNDISNTSEFDIKNETLEKHDDEVMCDNELMDQNDSEHLRFNEYKNKVPAFYNTKLPAGAISKPVEYMCNHCGEIFNEREDYMKHSSEHTVGCLKTKEKLDQNPQKITNVIVSQCDLCEKSFVDGACLKKHKQLVHIEVIVQRKKKPSKIYQCDSCSKAFSSGSGLTSHTKKFHKEVEKEAICDQCAKVFKSLATLVVHQNSCHNESHICEPIVCPDCGKVFTNKHKFYFHKKIHVQVQCSVCGAMVQKTKLDYHMKQKHTADQDKPYQCKICLKGFSVIGTYRDHQNIHTGEKPYKCKYCSAAFASNGTKAMHQKSHLGIKRKQKNR